MKLTGAILCLGFLWTASVASGDTLRLRNGAMVQGTYLGGDTRQVKFLTPGGDMKAYAVADVATIEFATGAATSPAPAPAPAPQPAAAAAPAPAGGVTVPTGTVVSVRMIDSIDAKVTGVGERFRASIDDPVIVDGYTVIPRGADATVQIMKVKQSGTLKGSDELAIKLYDITVNGKQYDVVSNYAQVKGKGKGKKTAKTTALTTGVGAALGAIIGGGKGAAIGAGAGAATGVGVSAARGTHLKVPSETRLDFSLRSPLPLN